MKKILLLSLVSLFAFAYAFGQKKQNYVFLVDCTISTINEQPSSHNGKGHQHSFDNLPQNALFVQMKNFLIKNIEQITDGTSVITIIPFADKPSGHVTFNKSEYNSSKQEEILQALLSLLNSDQHYTGLCGAWDYGRNNFLNSNYENQFIVLTDGKENSIAGHNENIGCQQLCERIKSWNNCEYNNSATIISLYNNPNDPIIQQIKASVDSNNNTFFDTELHFSGFFKESKKDINIHTLNKDGYDWDFSKDGKYPVILESSDKFFDVKIKGNCIVNRKLHLYVSLKPGVNKSDVNNSHIISLKVISSTNSFIIRNPEISIRVSTIIVPNLNIKAEELDLKKANSYYGPWKDEKTQDTLLVDLNMIFNQKAKDAQSSITFHIKPTDTKAIAANDYFFLFNGKKYNANDPITVNATDKDFLYVVVKGTAKNGEYYFTISGESSNLSTINDVPTTKYTNTFRFEKETSLNPQFRNLLILLLIFLAIILFTIFSVAFVLFVRWLKAPKFPLSPAGLYFDYDKNHQNPGNIDLIDYIGSPTENAFIFGNAIDIGYLHKKYINEIVIYSDSLQVSPSVNSNWWKKKWCGETILIRANFQGRNTIRQIKFKPMKTNEQIKVEIDFANTTIEDSLNIVIHVNNQGQLLIDSNPVYITPNDLFVKAYPRAVINVAQVSNAGTFFTRNMSKLYNILNHH